MDQEISSSTISVSSDSQSSSNWISIPARLWSRTAPVLRRIYSGIQSLRNPLGSDVSATLNVDRISASLAVTGRAEFDGRNELPRSTEEVVTGTQKEIIFYFKDLQRKAQKRVIESGVRLRDFADGINIADTVANLNDIPPRCENELLRRSSDLQAELDCVREREVQQQRHYEEFREANQLKRVARYPSSRGLPFTIMALVIVTGTIAFREILAGLASSALVPTSWTFLTLMLVALVPYVIARSMFRLINHVGEGLSLSLLLITFQRLRSSLKLLWAALWSQFW